MEHPELVSPTNLTSTTANDTPETPDPLSAPSETKFGPQQDLRSPFGDDAWFAHPEPSLQSSASIGPPATCEDGPLSDSTPIGIDWTNFNASSTLIPGHPLNELFPEIIEDFPELSDPVTIDRSVSHWSLSDLTPMDLVADSAALVDQKIDLTNINAADYEGIILQSDRLSEKPMAVCSHSEPLTSESGCISKPSNAADHGALEETKVAPYSNDVDEILSHITSEEFECALTDFLTSHPGHQISMPYRTRPRTQSSSVRANGFGGLSPSNGSK
ncbi:MAG: hypothetical protein L6R36_005990 [Xanthoria steineri]|nr:MAG: hypothetical protein L6R36_005990 [Xanthoria steineri]